VGVEEVKETRAQQCFNDIERDLAAAGFRKISRGNFTQVVAYFPMRALQSISDIVLWHFYYPL
jgi:hypothetical protein